MASTACSRSAVLLILAAAFLAVGQGRLFTHEEIKTITDGIQKARNDAHGLEEYTQKVIDNIEPVIETLDGDWNVMIYGNQVPIDCERGENCYFELYEELNANPLWVNGIMADYYDTHYKVVVFRRGWINKCDSHIKSGSHNWWFTYRTTNTKCFTAYPIQDGVEEECKVAGKCYVEWDCPKRDCLAKAPTP